MAHGLLAGHDMKRQHLHALMVRASEHDPRHRSGGGTREFRVAVGRPATRALQQLLPGATCAAYEAGGGADARRGSLALC
jgi:hypothetical protein